MRRRPASGVAGGQDDVVGVVQQMDQLEVVGKQVGNGRMVVDERQVSLTGAQARTGLVGLGLLHRKLHVGVALVEGGHRTWGQRGVAALKRDEPQAAAAQAGQCRELLLG